MILESVTIDKKKLIISSIFPIIFVLLIWSIKIIEVLTNSDFSSYGIYPLQSRGLIGIITGPLVHGNWKHLFNNTFPLLFLTWTVFYFYSEVSYKVFFLIYFISGFWLWFFAREAFHIGASGLIYGLGAFVFVSGIIRKNRHLLSISLLVAFLYGSMVWGIFPLEQHISWESHLLGMIAGIILAIYYKNEGPPLTKHTDLEINEEDEDIMDIATINYLEYEKREAEKEKSKNEGNVNNQSP